MKPANRLFLTMDELRKEQFDLTSSKKATAEDVEKVYANVSSMYPSLFPDYEKISPSFKKQAEQTIDFDVLEEDSSSDSLATPSDSGDFHEIDPLCSFEENFDEGRLDLSKVDIVESKAAHLEGYYTSGLVLLPSMRVAIKKKLLCSDERQQYKPVPGSHFQPEEVNALFCPEIAEQLGISSAKYILAKENESEGIHSDSGNEYSKHAIITPSFLKKGDVLYSVAKVETEMRLIKDAHAKTNTVVGISSDMNEVFEHISAFAKKCANACGIPYTADDENSLKLEYAKQRFFHRFIDNTDEHLGNFAVIVNDGKVRMAPVFDFDFSLSRRMDEYKENGKVPDWAYHVMKCNNGDCNLSAVVQNFKDVPGFKEFLLLAYANLDLNKIVSNVEKNINCKLDKLDPVIKKSLSIIDNSKKELENAYSKLWGKEDLALLSALNPIRKPANFNPNIGDKFKVNTAILQKQRPGSSERRKKL